MNTGSITNTVSGTATQVAVGGITGAMISGTSSATFTGYLTNAGIITGTIGTGGLFGYVQGGTISVASGKIFNNQGIHGHN